MDQVIGKSLEECPDCGDQLDITNLDAEKIFFECEQCGQTYESKRPGHDPAFPDTVNLQKTGEPRQTSSEGENR